MPLSEHEQRLLEQIERQLLAEDPKFASTVRNTDPRHHALRRVAFAVTLALIGVVLMVFGVTAKFMPAGIPVLGILGFLVMFAAAVLGVQSYRRVGRSDSLRVVDSDGKPQPRPRHSFFDRLEERWRRRPESNR